MLWNAILLGVITGASVVITRIGGNSMFSRPLVLGTLVGIALGDMRTGIICGGTLEAIWMGMTGIGGAVPADITVGGCLGTAYTILLGSEPEAAIALAVPIAMLAQSFNVGVKLINTVFVHRAESYADKGDADGVVRMHWAGVSMFFLCYFLVIFLAIFFGTDAVGALVAMIPQSVVNALSVAGGLLPAIGMGILLQMLLDKKIAPYFVVGFALAACMGVNTITVSILGGALAVILYNRKESAMGGA